MQALEGHRQKGAPERGSQMTRRDPMEPLPPAPRTTADDCAHVFNVYVASGIYWAECFECKRRYFVTKCEPGAALRAVPAERKEGV